jgi:hypothetical protein
MLIPVGDVGMGAEERLGIGVNLYLQIDGNIDEYYNELKTKDIAIVIDTLGEPFGIRNFTVKDTNAYKLTFNQVSKAVKPCMSCGMLMAKPEDFGGGNPQDLYCVHCLKPDDSLKTYEQVLEGMVKFMMVSQKLDRKAAESAAEVHMAAMPAWSGRARVCGYCQWN